MITQETAMMARPKKSPKTRPVRLTDEAIRWAEIASGYTGESLAEYVSRTLAEVGQKDVERLHTQLRAAKRPKGTE